MLRASHAMEGAYSSAPAAYLFSDISQLPEIAFAMRSASVESFQTTIALGNGALCGPPPNLRRPRSITNLPDQPRTRATSACLCGLAQDPRPRPPCWLPPRTWRPSGAVRENMEDSQKRGRPMRALVRHLLPSSDAQRVPDHRAPANMGRGRIGGDVPLARSRPADR